MSSTQSDMAQKQPTQDDLAQKLPDLLDHLERLVRMTGTVTLRANDDGTFDVRAGGTATYARRLRHALDRRVEMEMVKDVTRALEDPGKAMLAKEEGARPGAAATASALPASRPSKGFC